MGIPTAPPKWFTPARLLAIFCCTNLMVYLDRGEAVCCVMDQAPASFPAFTSMKITHTLHSCRLDCQQWCEWISTQRHQPCRDWHPGESDETTGGRSLSNSGSHQSSSLPSEHAQSKYGRRHAPCIPSVKHVYV